MKFNRKVCSIATPQPFKVFRKEPSIDTFGYNPHHNNRSPNIEHLPYQKENKKYNQNQNISAKKPSKLYQFYYKPSTSKAYANKTPNNNESKYNDTSTKLHTSTRYSPFILANAPVQFVNKLPKPTEKTPIKAVNDIYIMKTHSITSKPHAQEVSKTEIITECHTPLVKPTDLAYTSCTSKDRSITNSFSTTEYRTTVPTTDIKVEEWKGKCKCAKEKGARMCERAKWWLYSANHQKSGKTFSYEAMKCNYQAILKLDCEIEEEVEQQIKRDLSRTFPRHKWFINGGGMEELHRVLRAYAIYSKHIGYVQGMNFICGTLLYHCAEEVAFWLFVILLEDYDLEDVYMVGLPGLYKHTQMINMLISTNSAMRDIYTQLV